MTTTRLYAIGVVALWLLAMGWLFATKILPALTQGTPPDIREEFVREKEAPPPPVAWDLFWNDEPLGTTISQAYTDREGEPAEFRSLVQIRQLEVQEFLNELLGGLSIITTGIFGSEHQVVDGTIATRVRLDWEGELQGFDTAVSIADSFDFTLRGQRTEEDKLHLTLMTNDAKLDVPRDLNLPEKSRYYEAFSPRTRMQGLSVGQKWTTPVVDPLSTSNAVKLVESLVEKRETITWQDESVETFVVSYRYDSGSGSASRGPVGRAWVREDGLVIRQQLPIGSANVRFERMDDARAIELGEALEGRNFDKHLHGQPK